MDLAFRMASRAIGTTANNPAVGCVIVKDNNIISRGWTQPSGRPHAEIVRMVLPTKLLPLYYGSSGQR